MAIACFRLLTAPPLPAFPERNVPRLRLRMARSTDLLALFPYLSIASPPCFVCYFSLICENMNHGRTAITPFGKESLNRVLDVNQK
jgi:hypothetical protein